MRIKLAKRFIVMKSLGWWALAAALVAIVSLTRIESLILSREINVWGELAWEESIFLAVIAAILLSKTVYFVLYRQSFSLAVRDGAISVATGIFFRRHYSIPLNKILHAEIGYDVPHLLVGLYFVRIQTPGHRADNSGNQYRIEGLQKKAAVMLQSLIEQSFIAKNRGNTKSAARIKGICDVSEKNLLGVHNIMRRIPVLNLTQGESSRFGARQVGSGSSLSKCS